MSNASRIRHAPQIRHTAHSPSRTATPARFPPSAGGRIPRLVCLAALASASAVWLAGCAGFSPPAPAPEPRDPYLAAFSAQMTGMNEQPPVPGVGTGRVDAVFNKNTNLLRWRLTYTGLSGQPTMGHFHGPAAVGVNAPVVLPFAMPLKSPMDGQATLTPAQAADLLAGRWYANVHTAAKPAGEIRGQMILRE